ncbi:MAG: alpha/beta hydrolase, partial [Geminicoccaceae bacterium]
MPIDTPHLSSGDILGSERCGAVGMRSGAHLIWLTLCVLVAAIAGDTAAKARVIHEIAVPSTTLGQSILCAVTLPDGYDLELTRRYPLLLLLHGTDGTHHDWLDWGGLEEGNAAVDAATGTSFIIVTPNAGNSWYVDNPDGEGAWETALVGDLLPVIDARFRTISNRAGRVIAGLSMGGYGAVHLALRHPELFAATASLSGAFYAPEEPVNDDDIADFHGAFGNPFDAERFARESVYTDLAALPPDAVPP